MAVGHEARPLLLRHRPVLGAADRHDVLGVLAMIAVRNPHAVVRLARTMIQHVPRGATPSRTITAPEPCERADLITEAERQAYFERSRNFHATSANAADPSPLGQGLAGVAPTSEDVS